MSGLSALFVGWPSFRPHLRILTVANRSRGLNVWGIPGLFISQSGTGSRKFSWLMDAFRAGHVTLFPWPPFHIDGQGYYSQGFLQSLPSVIWIMPPFHLIASYLRHKEYCTSPELFVSGINGDILDIDFVLPLLKILHKTEVGWFLGFRVLSPVFCLVLTLGIIYFSCQTLRLCLITFKLYISVLAGVLYKDSQVSYDIFIYKLAHLSLQMEKLRGNCKIVAVLVLCFHSPRIH